MATRTFHLICGQSNARGAAQKVDLTDLRYDITQTDVRQYTRLDTVFGGTASAAMTIPSGSFSIEAAYGYHLRNDAGELPLIFRDGWSGTSLAGSWQPEAAGGEWANALDAMWQCYEAAKTEFSGDDLVFGSLVWIQGEADVQNSTFAAAYEANLVKLGNAFRGELGADLPIVFVQLSENCGVTPGSPGDLAVVRAAYVSAAATLGNCAVVDATPIALQADDVHYTADGLMELGDDVYAAYATLASGTQLTRTGRAFGVVDSAHTFANAAQAAVGDRDENPANGGFGRRLGAGCRDPWPTTTRDTPLQHPYQNVWYVPIDSVMVADGSLDVTTNARPIDLAWSNLIPAGPDYLLTPSNIPLDGTTQFEQIAQADVDARLFSGSRWTMRLIHEPSFQNTYPIYLSSNDRIIFLTSGQIRWVAGGVVRSISPSPTLVSGDDIVLDLDFVSGDWSISVNGGAAQSGAPHTGPVSWTAGNVGLAQYVGLSYSTYFGLIYPPEAV